MPEEDGAGAAAGRASRLKMSVSLPWTGVAGGVTAAGARSGACRPAVDGRAGAEGALPWGVVDRRGVAATRTGSDRGSGVGTS